MVSTNKLENEQLLKIYLAINDYMEKARANGKLTLGGVEEAIKKASEELTKTELSRKEIIFVDDIFYADLHKPCAEHLKNVASDLGKFTFLNDGARRDRTFYQAQAVLNYITNLKEAAELTGISINPAASQELGELEYQLTKTINDYHAWRKEGTVATLTTSTFR